MSTRVSSKVAAQRAILVPATGVFAVAGYVWGPTVMAFVPGIKTLSAGMQSIAGAAASTALMLVLAEFGAMSFIGIEK